MVKRIQNNWGFLLVLICALIRVLSFTAANHFQKSPVPIPQFICDWRDNYLQLLNPYDHSGLARAIFLGNTQGLTRPVIDTFRKGGLAHLVAASGFNCWIVGALFVTFWRIVVDSLHANPCLKNKHIENMFRIFGAWLFWAWTDQSPPVTRAAIFLTARAFFDKWGLTLPTWRLLAVQYLISLCVRPSLARSASFELSFWCLFGIFSFTELTKSPLRYILDRMRKKHRKAGKVVLTYIATSLGACIGVAPITWIVFGEINFSSLLTNWIAVPPVSFVIMPLGLLQILFCSESLARLNGFICDWYYQAMKLWIDLIPCLRYAPFRDV